MLVNTTLIYDMNWRNKLEKRLFAIELHAKLFWAKKVHNLLISQIVNNCQDLQEFSNVELPVCILMGELPYVV